MSSRSAFLGHSHPERARSDEEDEQSESSSDSESESESETENAKSTENTNRGQTVTTTKSGPEHTSEEPVHSYFIWTKHTAEEKSEKSLKKKDVRLTNPASEVGVTSVFMSSRSTSPGHSHSERAQSDVEDKRSETSSDSESESENGTKSAIKSTKPDENTSGGEAVTTRNSDPEHKSGESAHSCFASAETSDENYNQQIGVKRKRTRSPSQVPQDVPQEIVPVTQKRTRIYDSYESLSGWHMLSYERPAHIVPPKQPPEGRPKNEIRGIVKDVKGTPLR
ncbi:hypothetical protein BJ138DRAFT_1127830 [Hygrophoropsis aurantiaca]|uniref:Uncharacterized protein n=1 Tax=Hygrophoropsis aurantiaca TaxID=72124 RepID=A0ACB8A7N7_9AGAM|nr:hypothetical protein BJ138DRAFT_1127830 [Hygrophoropsis aurantiaca]